MVCPVSWAVLQDKPAIAITAIDIARLVNLKIDQRMAECRWTIASAAANAARPVTADAAGFDRDDFTRHGLRSRIAHGGRINRALAQFQSMFARFWRALLVVEPDLESTGVKAGGLRGVDIQRPAHAEQECAISRTDQETLPIGI